MAVPPEIDRTIFQGDNYPPLVWGFGAASDPEDLTGAMFVLIVSWRDPITKVPDQITAASDPATGLTIDLEAGTVSWLYTALDSARLPRGKHARYQLTCIKAGAIQTRAQGDLTVSSGLIG